MTALDMVDRYLPGRSVEAWPGRPCTSSSRRSSVSTSADLSGLAVIDNFVGHTQAPTSATTSAAATTRSCTRSPTALPRGSITMDAPLRALHRRRDGRIVMRFGHTLAIGGRRPCRPCLPFTTLREVDLDGARLSRRKRRCIAELGMGTNAKVILQFARRPQKYGQLEWLPRRSSEPYFDVWESSAGPAGCRRTAHGLLRRAERRERAAGEVTARPGLGCSSRRRHQMDRTRRPQRAARPARRLSRPGPDRPLESGSVDSWQLRRLPAWTVHPICRVRRTRRRQTSISPVSTRRR